MEYSEHINEIIEKKPKWLVRFGITGLLFLLLIILVAAWFVKYPDVIKGAVSVVTPNPPIDLVAKVSANLDKKFGLRENDTVKADQPLLLLKSTTSLYEILYVKRELSKEIYKDSLNISELWVDSLGALQPIYDEYMLSKLNLAYYKNSKSYDKRITKLSEVIRKHGAGLVLSEDQLKNRIEDLELQKKDLKRYSILFEKGVISESEYEEMRRYTLEKEIGLINVQKTLNSEQSNIYNLNKTQLELELEKESHELRLKLDYQKRSKELKNAIDEWESQYLIKASIDGKISFFQESNIGDFIEAGTKILTIIPLQEDKLQAVGLIPIENSGKIKIGNRVIIKLNSYPFQEYGTVDGIVSRISEIPSDSTYHITILLPNKLMTSNKKEIHFKQLLSGSAEIITEDRSVLQRIFSQIQSVLAKK